MLIILSLISHPVEKMLVRITLSSRSFPVRSFGVTSVDVVRRLLKHVRAKCDQRNDSGKINDAPTLLASDG